MSTSKQAEPMPSAAGARAVERHQIRVLMYNDHRDAIARFVKRFDQGRCDRKEFMIIVANVDDPCGTELANDLMRGVDWSSIRAKGQVPYARGVVTRSAYQDMFDSHFPDVAAELRAIRGVAVFVCDNGILTAFDADELLKLP